MSNVLNLQFGPNLVDNCLPIAFISSKGFSAESLAVFSQEQYVVDNVSRVRSLNFNPSGLTVLSATASVSFEAIPLLGVSASSISSGSLPVENGAIVFKHISTPVTVAGIKTNPDKSFTPLISKGCFIRLYLVQNEPAWSWLSRAGYVDGDKLLLVYQVPETVYSTFTTPASTDSLFPNSSCLVSKTETVYPASPTQLVLKDSLEYITNIVVGSLSLFSGKQSWQESGDTILSFTQDGVISLNTSLDPDVEVTVTYLQQPLVYNYRGHRFFDGSNSTYKSLDLNPEYGRRTYSDTSSGYVSSIKALYDEVQIYLVPVAAAKLSFTEASKGVFTGSIAFKSAYNYGETHFVRHLVGALDEDFNEDYGLSAREFYNYWGTSVFGQTEYDYLGSGLASNDVFSSYLPSMAPIGKITLAKGGLGDYVDIVDLRTRGGGVNTEEAIKASKYSNPGLATIQELFDLGTWGGSLIYRGGIVEVSIDKSVLDEFTQQEVDDIVKFHMPLGVEYYIKYVD